MFAMIANMPCRHSGEGRNPVKHAVRSTRHKTMSCAAHSVFVLDSGLRRNDGEVSLGAVVI
jgi:hypothetical protein